MTTLKPIDEGAIELYEFSYPKYGEHVVAMRPLQGGSGLQLFDTVKLFAADDTLKEYERVKDEAAVFAKKFVAQFNQQHRTQQVTEAEFIKAAEASREFFPSRMYYDPRDPTASKWATDLTQQCLRTALQALNITVKE